MHLGLVGASGAQFEPWEWGQGHQLKQALKKGVSGLVEDQIRD